MLRKDYDRFGSDDSIREFMYRKLDQGDDAVISSTKISGRIYGKIVSVGNSFFSLQNGAGEIVSISFDEVSDFE